MTFRFSLLIIFGLFSAVSFAAQDGPARFRVATISIAKAGTVLPQLRGLYDGLGEAGYIDGRNLRLYSLQSEDINELRQRLKRLLDQGIDVIVSTATEEATLAQSMASKTPIVFSPAIDPARLGFVQSRSHPGGNLTGVRYSRGIEDNAKQLAVYKQVVPNMRRVTMFYDLRPINQPAQEVRAIVERTATRYGMQLAEKGVLTVADAVHFIQDAPVGAIDGVFIICSSMFGDLKSLADATLRRRVPLFGCNIAHVSDEGATLTYAPDLYLIGYRGAWYVDRILKGAKAATLPVETPNRFELAINLSNARAIGAIIPTERLILAEKVFR